MVFSGVIRGYELGKRQIDLADEMRLAGIKSSSEISQHSHYAQKDIQIAEQILVLARTGSLCEKLGLVVAAPVLNPKKYANGLQYYLTH
jgi:hypothetical protein